MDSRNGSGQEVDSKTGKNRFCLKFVLFLLKNAAEADVLGIDNDVGSSCVLPAVRTIYRGNGTWLKAQSRSIGTVQSDDVHSLSETIYHRLSDQLLQGVLSPEERLKIRDIAVAMGTSVTPVRDALLRLVQEEALYLRSPRDIRVRSVSIDDYLEMRDIRLDLEGSAAAAAAAHATENDIRRLDRLVRQNARALRAGDRGLATDLNQQFHFSIVTIARMPVRAEILRRLWLRLGPWLTKNYAMESSTMIDFHVAALEAIRNRDPAGARKAMRNDLLIAGGAILQHYKRSQD